MATAAAIQARIDALDAAMDAIIERGATSYTVDGVTFTALDIEKLGRLKDKLNGELAGANTRRAAVTEFGRPD